MKSTAKDKKPNVAVAIISRKDNSTGVLKYLLVSAKKDFGEYTGYYYPPGGHIEAGENEPEALKRELREELGVNASPVKKLAETPGDVNGQITHWWQTELDDTDFKIDEAEISDAKWFSQEEMAQIKIWPATIDFFATYIFKK